MPKTARANVIIAASEREAVAVKRHYLQFRNHLVVIPDEPFDSTGILVGEYVWTPCALELPAADRMTLRGRLAPLMDDESVEEHFPETLLSW